MSFLNYKITSYFFKVSVIPFSSYLLYLIYNRYFYLSNYMYYFKMNTHKKIENTYRKVDNVTRIKLSKLFFDEKIANFLEKDLHVNYPKQIENCLVELCHTFPLTIQKYNNLNQEHLKNISVIKTIHGDKYQVVNGRHRIAKIIKNAIDSNENLNDIYVSCIIFNS